MLGFFPSEQKKMRRNAQNWLHLAGKIYHFRRDQLKDAELSALQQGTNDLRTKLKKDADASTLKLSIERLEDVLRKIGGSYYPKSALVENVEFFFVAIILFLGIRAFFIQPFKIPTNSMWPTYYGMTADVYHNQQDEPGFAGEAARFLMFGAQRHTIVAPVDGELKLPIVRGSDGAARLAYSEVTTRKWLIIPAKAHKYIFFIGNREVSVTVPEDFRLEEQVLDQAFGTKSRTFGELLTERLRDGDRSMTQIDLNANGRSYTVPATLIGTGLHFKAGQHVLSFDILTGDQLFVDRMTYNFVPPKVGQGFVFRTWHIPNIEPSSGQTYVDRYYIKRLVGTPGDTLEVRAPRLYRNGAPITGAAAFEKEAEKKGKYPGYTNARSLEAGQTVTVPADFFFAMGDNSPNSWDSRYWGFVPARDVVGRPLFVYYPFTRRWGPTD